ncbi:rRNA-processing protein bfr2 [Vermiconidia calcicola]|uniref:rRNA-processing protein bfr2 n=1 Tax=Vermiconidia calcicola TaxID=1690605 RepID=A0ACC3ND87_9PEZI|nr:rRNA-processing protein bfr2 [Vermiconidia calcicola]
MALTRGPDRSKDFDDVLDSAPKDFDPEAEDVPNGKDDSDVASGDETTEVAARQHYVDVGKSKLRKPKDAPLGPQYRGSRISRNATIAAEDEDDPFGRGFEEDSSSEKNGDMHLDGEEVSSAEEEHTNGETSDTDLSDEEDDGVRGQTSALTSERDRSELLKAVAKDQKAVASSLAQSTKLDAEKGRAVKKQRTNFDSLLNARIKLQKSLVETNTIVGASPEGLPTHQQEAKGAIKAAENAAFKLWSSLNELREQMIAVRTGDKRKRNAYDSTTPTEDLWNHVQAQEASCLPHRNATLQRWSVKARGASALPERGLMGKAANQSTLIEALREQLSNRERLLKRARTPRSCAPLQLANKVDEDKKIYDDADFYGIMLKELLEQKSNDSVAASNIDLNFNLRREAKAKKNVDTKASKGRKLRYTVHEKLQNFMAPEDRSTWGDRQTDELFGSLFGQRLGLGEGREEDDEMENVAAEEEAGLKLFRN